MAAGALPTTRALLGDAPTTVVFTPETTSAQTCLPEPQTLKGRLRWAERGSRDWHARRRLQDAGGFLLIRANAGRHPQVVEALRDDGTRRRSLRHQPRKASHANLPKRQRGERVVPWQVEAQTLRLRLRIRWNRRTQAFCSVVTNLPAQREPLAMLSRAYPWRGHVA